MSNKKLNRGLRPTGRMMMIMILVVFLMLFAITGVSFAVIAHTGIAGGYDLFEIAATTQLLEDHTASRRGTITDVNGVVIARQHPSYRLFANLNPAWGSAVLDIEYTAHRLSEVINLTPERIIELLSQDLYHVEFGAAGLHLSFIEASQIIEMELPGIRFDSMLTRFYPQGAFASHVIGYTRFGDVSAGEEELIGAMGIEAHFNELLTGRDGRFVFYRDRYEFRQPGTDVTYLVEPLDGYNIRLTINATIQGFLEMAMDEVALNAKPENITAVVMNAKTGEILAAGSRPTFDPNVRNPESYANAIMYPAELGSTVKIFTYAAAINEGNYRGNQVFTSGNRTIYGVTVHDFSQSWGEMTFNEGFYRSSNTAIIDIFQNWLSFSRWIDYLEAFGFGAPTGLPLPEEHAGLIPAIAMSPVDLYMTGFGQGPFMTTPVQILQATSAIVNDGNMIRPQLIAEIYDPNTNTQITQFEREVVATPITAATAEQMRALMAGVITNEIGTGRVNYLLDVASGGKTGTAQVPGPGGYLAGVHIYNYVGFAPLDDPELIMFVSVKNPTTTTHTNGHPYAGEIYRFVMNNTLSYLGLANVATTGANATLIEVERVPAPTLINLSTDDAIALALEAGFVPVVIGNQSNVFRQSPMPNTSTIVGDKIFIQTDTVANIESFTGWSLMQINRYAMMLGLDVTFDGQGFGVRQTIRAGSEVSQGDSLTVTLE